ncbi:TPA: ABC transporter ATP-binding protein [Candidatus Woesearchaeota archaeon]|nr:ABC transporter ATP-binding protein [Candidatus Woesearchaeota archaeon]
MVDKHSKGDNNDTLIELKNVWKTYDMGHVKVHALRGMDLKVKRDEFISIMGPSGSGKSTAMNMVGALDVPSKGTILLGGHDISKLHESDLAQIRGRKIGFIFQQFNLINTLTAKENVMLSMMFQGKDEAARMKRAEALLDLVGLSDRINHKPSELSGGQQQRVAIARALANDPEIILADEPTGNLDSKSGEIIMEILTKLHVKEGKTVILVTHDAHVAHHAEKIYLLKDGFIEGSKAIKRQMHEKVLERGWDHKKIGEGLL